MQINNRLHTVMCLYENSSGIKKRVTRTLHINILVSQHVVCVIITGGFLTIFLKLMFNKNLKLSHTACTSSRGWLYIYIYTLITCRCFALYTYWRIKTPRKGTGTCGVGSWVNIPWRYYS